MTNMSAIRHTFVIAPELCRPIYSLGSGFYRATLCIARYMLSCGVRPSVRPSVTLVHCAELIIKQLAPDYSLFYGH